MPTPCCSNTPSGRDRSYVWAVTPSSLSVHELPARIRIEAEARAAYDAITNSHRVGRRAEARIAIDALSKTLLAPVARDIGGRRILIVADGALQFVPFSALTDPSGETRGSAAGRPLAAAHEILTVPSASVIDALRQPQTRPATDRTVAVFADPVLEASDSRVAASIASRGVARPDREAVPSAAASSSDLLRSAADVGVGGFTRLRFTRAEARVITSLAGRADSLTAVDFAASRATATDPGLSRYRIVHFATHAFADSEHPELSGIVLSLIGPEARLRTASCAFTTSTT
jgi:CHAT domain-containing protein